MATKRKSARASPLERKLRRALASALNKAAPDDAKTRRLDRVAEALVERAMEGELGAIREIFARIERAASEQQAGAAEGAPAEGGPVIIEVVTGIDRAPNDPPYGHGLSPAPAATDAAPEPPAV